LTVFAFTDMLRVLSREGLSMTRIFAALLFLVATTAGVAAQERRQDRAGEFDFYVLSLSWSPSFCSTQKDGRNEQQCGTDKSFRFIVHGLWPQYEKGYPDFCRTSEPDSVPRALGEPLFDIMPSMGLIGHEWKKHGSCSGLSQGEYLAKTRQAYDSIRIPAEFDEAKGELSLSPDQVEEKFVAANPGMTAKGISTSCRGRQFQEVRICLSKDLKFRDCEEVNQDTCEASRVTLPPAR
jgi:ribonuclease T2